MEKPAGLSTFHPYGTPTQPLRSGSTFVDSILQGDDCPAEAGGPRAPADRVDSFERVRGQALRVGPGAPAVGRVQHRAAAADRPALGLVKEPHVVEVVADARR